MFRTIVTYVRTDDFYHPIAFNPCGHSWIP